jgi:putative transposase
MGTWSFSSQQATLRRLNKAFAAFFRRVKLGEAPGYPRFKAEHRFASVEWPKDGDGCRWHPETSRVSHHLRRRARLQPQMGQDGSQEAHWRPARAAT